MSFGWHPREHRAALDGMLMLTLEERGAYNTLLDLIYDRAGPIQDDPRWLAGWMGVSTRRWSLIRASLIFKGKIYAETIDGAACLMNARAAIEIENQAKRQRNLRESGAKGGRKRAENEVECNENKDLGQASAQADLKLKTETGQDKETTTIDAGDWRRMFSEAKAAAGDAADLTRPAMHHVADLRALVEPNSGDPCTWDEVLTAIAMTAMRQRAKGKPIQSWTWVRDDAWSLRDKRLNAAAPAVADVIPIHGTGPPSGITAQIAADHAEARRRVLES